MDVKLTITIPFGLLQWRRILKDEYDQTRPAARIQFERLCDVQTEVCDIVQDAWKNAQSKENDQ
ncbi:MAG: hypothetical protein E6474_09750 [Actinomyces sp.]|mgnify:FL=1|nr:hypothetical protein [Finegoldia magna]MBS5942859.1 hypothetical protein [Finegoldia magna]MDU6662571.1 hypothetical protein [Actinomyces sp.]